MLLTDLLKKSSKMKQEHNMLMIRIMIMIMTKQY